MSRRKRPALPVPELIARKRNGETLAEAEIRALIDGFMDGSVADYFIDRSNG